LSVDSLIRVAPLNMPDSTTPPSEAATDHRGVEDVAREHAATVGHDGESWSTGLREGPSKTKCTDLPRSERPAATRYGASWDYDYTG
jgi:hypothetical protein